VGLTLLIFAAVGLLASIGLAFLGGRRPTGGGGGAPLETVLVVVGETVFDAAGEPLVDPCSIDASRVRVDGARGSHRAVEALIGCLRARGVVVLT
jgi:hypothetical protein